MIKQVRNAFAILKSSLGADNITFSQNVANAQPVPLADDLRMFTHPMRFGAVGDGVTDDKQALQRCFNYAKSVGAEINLYGKTYATSGAIYLNKDNSPAKGVHLHNGKIIAIGTGWTTTEFSTVLHIKIPTDPQINRRHSFDRVDIDCNGLAHYGWVFNRPSRVHTSFCTATNYNGAGFYIKGDGDGVNDAKFIGCTANEVHYNVEPKASTYSARTGVGYLVESAADVEFVDCVASMNKYNVHLTGTFWNGMFTGCKFWSGPTREDPTCVCIRIDADVNRVQFINCRIDDGAVVLYNFNQRFIGNEFIQWQYGSLHLVATTADEDAEDLRFIGNVSVAGNSLASPEAILLTEGSGSWGEVKAEWAHNTALKKVVPWTIQNKSLITKGLTIEGDDVNLTSGNLKIAGTKVLGPQDTGWAAATGTASKAAFNTATVTLEQLAQQVKAIRDLLAANGTTNA